MLHQASELTEGHVWRTDICIIGAGAAGITIAREFASLSAVSVCVLESGGLQADAATQDLYRGAVDGKLFQPGDPYLSASRLRYFGGSTNHWAGWCIPLDSSDFQKRDWLPHSGWPITRDTLEPYYLRAEEIVEIKPFNYDISHRFGKQFHLLLPKSTAVQSKVLHQSPPTRFGRKYRTDLEQAPNINVILGANAYQLQADTDGRRVREIVVKTLEGKTFSVQAKQIVLAAGGIENARLLLHSNSVHTSGLGNQNDLVGRFFMEHLEFRNVGALLLTCPASRLQFYRSFKEKTLQHPIYGIASVSEEVRNEQQLLNSGLFLSFPLKTSEAKSIPLELEMAETVTSLTGTAGGIESDSPYMGVFKVRAEQSPHPNSRVTLDTERDQLGMPRAKLHWEVHQQDKESVRKSALVVAKELGKLGEGRLRLQLSDSDNWGWVLPGHHHIGTTRMSETAATGIVDSNCRMHDVKNIWIAGSSVFPTSGFANPTLTLLALALRLADTLKEMI